MEPTVRAKIEELMGNVLAPAPLQALLVLVGHVAPKPLSSLTADESAVCLDRVKLALRVYCPDRNVSDLVLRRVSTALGQPADSAAPLARSVAAAPSRPVVVAPARTPPPPMSSPRPAYGYPARPPAPPAPAAVLRDAHFAIKTFDDAVSARMAAKDMAHRIGFGEAPAVRIATAVSELARNIVFYAGTGSVVLEPQQAPQASRRGLRVVATDQGPGIADLELVLSGRYKSTRGLGLGLKGVRQLMDDFHVDTGPGKGTRVAIAKYL